MSISREVRSLIFVAIFAISPAINAGDLRHLPWDLRAFYFDLLVLAYGLSPLTNTFSFFFPNHHNAHPTGATHEIDDLWSDQWHYEPIIIATSDNREIEISQNEFVQLQQHSVDLAAAITSAPNQHYMQLPISSLLLNLLQRTMPHKPDGIKPIFLEYKPETLLEMKDEAESIKCEYLSNQIEWFLTTSPRGRSPRSEVLPDTDVAKTPKPRANSLPPLTLECAISEKKGQAQQPACLCARELSPNRPINIEGQKKLRRATASLILPTRRSQPLTTESTTTATSTTVKTTDSLSGIKKTQSEPLTTEASSTATKTTSRGSRRTKDKAEPSTTEASTTATTTTVKKFPRRPPSPLVQVVEWFRDGEFQVEFEPVICFYYPYIVTDASLARFLRHLDMTLEENRSFVRALIKCFTAQGFPHTPDKVLLDELDSVIIQLGDKELEPAFRETLEKIDRELWRKEQLETAALSPRKNWQDYKDAEIASAWTFSDALCFRHLPPMIAKEGKPDIDITLFPMSCAFVRQVEWIISEIEQVKKERHKRDLVIRFFNIAKLMIGNGNFNSAFTIYCALLRGQFLDLAGDENMFLNQVFDPKQNFKMYRGLVKGFRDLHKSYLYIAGFYGKDFTNMKENANGYKQSLGKCPKENKSFDKYDAIQIGNFFHQMHQDQMAASYEPPETLRALIRFFMDLAKMDQEEI